MLDTDKVAEPKYRRLSADADERDQIANLKAAGEGVCAIARAIAHTPATVSCELSRNSAQTSYDAEGGLSGAVVAFGYCSHAANELARGRAQHVFAAEAAIADPPLKVFMSYRREDMQGLAWGIYWPLETRFGSDNVFFDNGVLRPGDMWLTEINAHLAQTDVLLALIGPRWQQTLNERLRVDGRDHVATEIELALQRDPPVTVIPVLVDDTRAPRADDLPMALKGLAAGHVERVRQVCLRDDIGQLIARLCEIAEEAKLDPAVVREPVPVAALAGADADAIVDVPWRGRIVGPSPRESDVEPDPDGTRPAGVAPEPDDEHYAEVVEEVRDTGIVVFLGAGVNSEDSETLPDDAMLARYLSERVKLGGDFDDLAEVAQYASALRGSRRLFALIRQGLRLGPETGHVHSYLARMPQRLAELGFERRPQMIVTPKYDAALEHALKDAHEPFDVVVYMGPGTDARGKFVHLPWDGEAVTIDVPNEYLGLPIRHDMSLERTVVVRISGSVVDADVNFWWKDNYVVTEDHFIQYLSGSPPAALIPGQLIEKLKNSSYLFIGYTMTDWRLRVFLKRLWPGERLGGSLRWAIERCPTRLEAKLCFDAGVTLYQSSATDYVDGFDRFLMENAGG